MTQKPASGEKGCHMTDPRQVPALKQGWLEQSIGLFSRAPILRYLFAIIMVALGIVLRIILTKTIGPGFATYITFYPVVIITAILAGFWPGILAAVLSAGYVIIWELPPYGVLAITNPVDAVGAMLFLTMGVLISAFAHSYHRTRERATAALEASNKELRRLNVDLQQRTAALETALKEMETFSYSVAHDLRSPLRSIDGFSKYLSEHATDRLNAQEQDYLQRMRAAAQRMARLIDDLLNLSRVVRTQMRIERVNLSTLAAEIIDSLRRRDPARQVTTDIAADLVVSGDRGLLRIALEHLLENAWKFTGTREEAHITFGVIQQEGERVYFVQDNGVGFDMTYVDKLFQPFQRLHTEKEFPGTGIGLALIQRIIQRHGGRIWAEAVEGQGASFYFTLGEGRVKGEE